MHVQIINFQLNGIDDAQYRSACDDDAAEFSALPGLLSKIWLADQPTNTYGGVYLWRDRTAMDGFVDGDVFRGLQADPRISNVTSRDFDVLEAPSDVTRGLPSARV